MKVVDTEGMQLTLTERESQISRGFTPQADLVHTRGELIEAARAHLLASEGHDDIGQIVWPWDPDLFHLNTPISSLAKAAALIAAEIDRRIAEGETY